MKQVWIVAPEGRQQARTYEVAAKEAALATTYLADALEEDELFEASATLRALAIALASHTPEVVEGLRCTVMAYLAQHDGRIAAICGVGGDE